MNFILGISCFYHDSAAALISNGNIISAIQEERLSRKKGDSSFPSKSIKYILEKNNITLSNIDAIVFYEKPIIKFSRIIDSFLYTAPNNFISFLKFMPNWLKEKVYQKKTIFNELKKIDNSFLNIEKIKFSSHHLSHAASAFYPSPFENSIIVTLDGVGEYCTTSVGIGNKNEIKIDKEIHFPHSLGLLYSTFTSFLGFKVNSGEYKLMGLSPYGRPKYYDLIKDNLIDIKEDGSFSLNLDYFSFLHPERMYNEKFKKLFSNLEKKDDIEDFNINHLNLANSVQKVIEEAILKICTHAKRQYNINNLCLAGGVALNCAANGKLINSGLFENIWVQPAAGDAGGALGAALAYCYDNKIIRNIQKNSMKSSYLGCDYSNQEIEKKLIENDIIFKKLQNSEIINVASELLLKNNIIGWFQGKMEYGPRALGNRSILANPKNKDVQKNLNLKIKFREGFRPFAPIVLKEFANKYFKKIADSPYMSFIFEINDNLKLNEEKNTKTEGLKKLNIARSEFPGVTHVDYTARAQTLDKDSNPLLYDLIFKFYEKTGCPMIINTSFNIRGEPLVCEPINAIKCFFRTDMDYLIIGNYMIDKKIQKNLKFNFEKFDKD